MSTSKETKYLTKREYFHDKIKNMSYLCKSNNTITIAIIHLILEINDESKDRDLYEFMQRCSVGCKSPGECLLWNSDAPE